MRKRRQALPVEERSTGQDDVRDEIAVPGGLAGEFGGDIRPGEQTGDGDVAAEELIDDWDEADVDAGTVAERRHVRREHLRAELAGDDADRP